MKRLYVIMILCLISVMRISAQQTINDAFFLPIEVEYGKDGGKTYSLQSDPLKILIPGFIENESVPNYAISFGLMIVSPEIFQSYLILNIANVKESSLFTAFKDNSEPVYSLNIGGTSFAGTGQDTGNGNFGIMFFASKDDFDKLTETLATEHNITASISKNATNLKIHIGVPNENNTQRAKGFGSFLLLMQSQLYDYAKNEISQPSNTVSSSSATGTNNGHAYVDLGLSVKWATCNVGATNPEDYGDYFAWGETTTKSTYNKSTYFDSANKKGTKFHKYGNYKKNDRIKLELSDDVAHVKWGGDWRMPTEKEMKELCEDCNWTWTTQNGVNGYRVSSKWNGNSIFLPAAGIYRKSSRSNEGVIGKYWSSSYALIRDMYGFYYEAQYLNFEFDKHYIYETDRATGLSVRAVCP